MRLYIQCAICEKKRSFVWNYERIPRIQNAVDEGWRSWHGDLYCPECAKEWRLGGGDRDVEELIWKELKKQVPKPR